MMILPLLFGLTPLCTFTRYLETPSEMISLGPIWMHPLKSIDSFTFLPLRFTVNLFDALTNSYGLPWRERLSYHLW
jgi:hypothetical protein